MVAEECGVLNKQNQIYWRLYANNERLKAEGESDWIKDEEYRDSIINVIGKAIGDCMALENEFKAQSRKTLGKQVILFDDLSKYENPYDYTIENWNCLFLYNAVNLAINSEEYWVQDNCDAKSLMEECHQRIKDHFYKVFGIPENDEELERELEKVNKDEKQIMENLEFLHSGKKQLIGVKEVINHQSMDVGLNK